MLVYVRFVHIALALAIAAVLAHLGQSVTLLNDLALTFGMLAGAFLLVGAFHRSR
jgi:hypothetical protein